MMTSCVAHKHPWARHDNVHGLLVESIHGEQSIHGRTQLMSRKPNCSRIRHSDFCLSMPFQRNSPGNRSVMMASGFWFPNQPFWFPNHGVVSESIGLASESAVGVSESAVDHHWFLIQPFLLPILPGAGKVTVLFTWVAPQFSGELRNVGIAYSRRATTATERRLQDAGRYSCFLLQRAIRSTARPPLHAANTQQKGRGS